MSTPNNNSDPSKSSNSSSTSKRFISQKIEHLLQSPPSDKPTLEKSPRVSDHSHRDDSPHQSKSFIKSSFTLKKLNEYKTIVLLAFLVAMGWLSYFIYYYGKPQSPTDIFFQVEKFFSWENTVPILSTPIISDVDNDLLPDIVFADHVGYLRAINPRNQKIIYQTLLGTAVIASLTEVEVDGNPPKEILVATQTGEFYTINQQGNYFYQSRKEFFHEALFAKPLSLIDLKVFFLSGMQGRLWGVHSTYGEVLWLNDNSLLAINQESIFASPMLVKRSDLGDGPPKIPNQLSDLSQDFFLLATGEGGTIAAYNPVGGGLIWEQSLADGFKASPSILKDNNSKKQYIIAAGIKGNIWLLSLDGKVVDRFRFPRNQRETFISSLGRGKFIQEQSDELIAVSKEGNIYLISLQTAGIDVKLSVQSVYISDDEFLSTPIIADFNQNGRDDVLVITRSGKLMLFQITSSPDPVDSSDQSPSLQIVPLIQPYLFNYQVTSTPVIGDLNGDGHVEVVVGGENGRLDIVSLRNNPKSIFSPYQLIYSQFLKNPLNRQ